ncbi:thioredoxin family protein [Candidatus Woesebacteria bacterium]|nr:MAG: thioredoxin family protein [Candidatus Woesebacteria bacterium]
MKIQVLGSGCPTCKKLFEITKKAVSDMKLSGEVDYLTGSEGIGKIIELGSMTSPVLSVDDKIAMVGFTPDIEKIKSAIREASK